MAVAAAYLHYVDDGVVAAAASLLSGECVAPDELKARQLSVARAGRACGASAAVMVVATTGKREMENGRATGPMFLSKATESATTRCGDGVHDEGPMT